jgi:hypothetical protein
MVRASFVCLLAIAGCTASSTPPPTVAPVAPPRLSTDPLDALFRPAFRTLEGDIIAGTAFLCRLDANGELLLVTAHHLFGIGGGMRRDYLPEELPKAIFAVDAWSLSHAQPLSARTPLTIPGAAPMSNDAIGRDVAAFVLSTPPDGAHVLSVATAPPPVEARVTLLAEVIGGTTLRHPATVAEVGLDYVAYVFDEPSVEIRATSGAPVVDEHGDVVAINLGGGTTQDGRSYGIGNPVSSFVPMLRAALARRPR